MKKVVIVFIAALSLLVMTATAFARTSGSSQGAEVDASLVLATAPASGLDTGFGINIGAGMMLPQINRDLQGRVEFSYFSWSGSTFGVDYTYKRMPIGAGGRFYLPIQSNSLKLYAQGLIELSFDEVEVVVPAPLGRYGTASESDINFGLVPGFGIELPINQNLGFVADARWHLITDNYFTVQGGLAYHF